MTSAQQAGKASSYYQMVTIRTPDGTSRHKVDRELKEAVINGQSGQGDGRLSVGDLENIIKKLEDGGKYGIGEKAITRALLAATDDRARVEIDGVRIRITDPAEKQLVTKVFSFFGSLGGRPKASDVQQAAQAALQFAQQLNNTQQA